MSYNLFLDDQRQPPAADWLHVKNLTEFKAVVRRNGPPSLISFDYRLGCEETGVEAVTWLAENMVPVQNYRIHSSSRRGRALLREALENYPYKM